MSSTPPYLTPPLSFSLEKVEADRWPLLVACARSSLSETLYCPPQGGLRNSKHECTLSSQEYVHELRSGITDDKLFICLESLRVSLTSNPVRCVPLSLYLPSACPSDQGVGGASLPSLLTG